MPATSLSFAIEKLTQQLIALPLPPAAQEDKVVQLRVEVDAAIPLIAWLASQQQYPRIYWHGRDKKEEVAAIGCARDFLFQDSIDDKQLALIYQQQKALSADPAIRYYGGVAFDRSIESWPEFGRARFILPRLELRRSGDDFLLALNLNFAEPNPELERQRALDAIKQLLPPRPLMPPHKVGLMARHDSPAYPRWQQLVQQVTEPTFNNAVPKVVLSRVSQLEVNEIIDPWMVLACWQGRNQNSFQFGFQFSPHRAFISCSPERLFQRRDRQLHTEALAGTTVRGLSQQEDDLLANQLLEDSKNSYENRLVQEHIVDVLTPLCEKVDADTAPKIFKLTHIQHLHRDIRAQLKAGVNDFELLQALHPTPAVGGLPRAEAMAFIRSQEGYLRGWYAGACGYLNKYESEFSVAIRSALLESGRISLYAGAGIVAGSDPKAEWQELENKLATIISILIDF
ncbi:isochorismate synthase [Shewanella sp. GXUN23E]|uniref:isochorismate synthase n=1 Tax=Shewanella sp. GXUN23E TaxID=3422498 RepID=UPI003D7E81B5